MPGTYSDIPASGYLSANVSRAVVRRLSEYTGRGPTKARTYINEDLITVVLMDTLTKGEHTLYRDGELELVLANRKAFQNSMSAALVSDVEELSGRQVIALLSDNHVDPDIAVESFVLAPRIAGVPANGDGGEG
jgi:uncharacterized protein YbcI